MSNQPNSLQAFFAELMRRRVFRVMAVYGATSFVLLQVADLLAEGMGLSDQVLRITTFAVLIGFPIAIVLAWAFESTPEGMKRTAPAEPEEIQQLVAAPRKHRWPAGLLALAGMGLLFWGGWWMGNRGAENPANIIVSEAQASGFKTLAVLPFENVNGNEENRLIAVGVHEDLLSQLSRISSIRVTSRTSVREYAETEKSLKDIAGELGVDYIMEGSVRSSGGQVRVTATLIDAEADEQLWNDQYDNEVTPENLFEIQSQVAASVVDELQAQLTPQDRERLDEMAPAASLAAQSWYILGVEAYGGAITAFAEARDHLMRAIEIDPEFVAAWSYLAQIESRLVFIGDADVSAALAAVERTADLAPGSIEEHLARGFYEYYARRDYTAALSAFESAELLAPSNAEVVWAIGLIQRRLGRWEESNEAMKRAVQLDPRNTLRLETLSDNLFLAGAYRETEQVAERQLAIDPTYVRARVRKAEVLARIDGNTGRASRFAAELAFDSTDPEESGILQELAWWDRDYERLVQLTNSTEAAGISLYELERLLGKARALHRLGDSGAVAAADSALEWSGSRAAQGGRAATRAVIHMLAGREDEARREAQVAERDVGRWDDHILNLLWISYLIEVYGQLGEIDAGFAHLEREVGRPSHELAVARLRLDPIFDPYRDDPRFDEVVAQRVAFEADGQRMADAGRPWIP